ncbi:hypothetical protein RCC89_00135 [Cytophagaceae bacterium ABcell3]|nr:hypothetical protein RCC89_00135 [Cytophagaceae bacterium ABcell3]
MQDNTLELEEQKKYLDRQTKLYEIALKDDLGELKEDIKRKGTKALLLGGIALAGLLIFRKLSRKKEKPGQIKKKVFYPDPETQMVVHQPKQESPILSMIKEHIALFLIGIIKEKIAAYIRDAELKYIANTTKNPKDENLQ